MKRVLILFLVKQLLLFGFFYLTLNLYSNSNFNNPDGEDIIIEIVSGNTVNDSLELYPSGTAAGYGGRKVTWRIRKSAPNVKSFRIKKKDSSEWGFKLYDFPPKLQTRQGTARLRDSLEKDYEYSIIWRDTKGKKHTHDPKIAVKPSLTFSLEWLINIVYVFFAGLISFMTFRKR